MTKFTTKFTIFTPTYNSAAFIHRAYESVRSQTRRDFEWIVIDDC
jgi:glycosyltransferase involved in cell wall biosynthesis